MRKLKLPGDETKLMYVKGSVRALRSTVIDETQREKFTAVKKKTFFNILEKYRFFFLTGSTV